MTRTDSPKPFQSAHVRAQVVTVLLGVGMVLNLIAIAATLLEIALLSTAMAGQGITEEEATASDALVGCVAIVQLVVYLATVVFFLLWIHRAHTNLPALGARNLRYSPGWAVASWFIPILNLFRPYQIVKEIWKASDPNTLASDGTVSPNASSSAVLGWWWALWLISNIAGQASFRFSQYAKSLADLSVSGWISIVSECLTLAATVLAILVVRAIDARQEERSKHLVTSPTLLTNASPA